MGTNPRRTLVSWFSEMLTTRPPPAESMRGTTGCPVQVYVDDIPFGQEEDIWIIRTWDVDTVEFYSGSQVPARYRSRLNACGLLLVWLKWY